MQGMPISRVAPRGCNGSGSFGSGGAGGAGIATAGMFAIVIVSFDSFRRTVPRELEPPSLFPEEEAGASSTFRSAPVWGSPFTVNVLLVFSGTSGGKFSLEGTFGSGRDGDLLGGFSGGGAFLTGVRLLAVEVVDRTDVEEGVFLTVSKGLSG